MFDEFQTGGTAGTRRPQVDNLYDVFVAIRDDEMEHVKTMSACQQPDAQIAFRSPHALPDGPGLPLNNAAVVAVPELVE
jgi:ubiquinol oxidase